jgi:hypothetical protein
LKQAGLDILQISLTMPNAGASTHHLNVACLGPADIAHAILMRDGTRSDIGDDLHVLMRVGGEAGMRGDDVIVPHPHPAPAHPGGILIVCERKMVMGIEPAVIGVAKLRKRSDLDHILSHIGGVLSPGSV